MSRDKQWYELPRPAAMAELVEIRDELRAKNLHDTEEPKLAEQQGPVAEELKAARTVDGSYNDLKCPMMGATGSRFGRNVPLTEAFPDTANLLNPNPRDISKALFTRNEVPAGHDSQRAGRGLDPVPGARLVRAPKGTADNTHDLPLADDDSWFERPMRIPKTPVDPPTVANSNRPPAYVNKNSHWWDGSNIYGSTKAEQDVLRVRSGGKVRVQDDGRLFHDETTGTEITGSRDNLWVGLSLLHSLFAREHNAICDMLMQEHSDWSDERLFQQARLINSALMAKIHTIEWTPAILPHPLLVLALNANWRGVLPGLQKVFRNLADNDLAQRHPGLADRSPHRAVLAHRGVRLGLPHALADSGRLRDPLGQGRQAARVVRAAGAVGPRRAQGDREVRLRRPVLLARRGASGRAPAAQLPEAPAEPAQGHHRRAARPGRGGHPARPRARRAALQPVPPAVPQAVGQDLRGALRQQGMGRGD